MDERIEAVQRMQDYIESNLEQDISMADLAKPPGTLLGILTACFKVCSI